MPPPQLKMFDEFWSPDKCTASLPALPSHAPQHQSVISAGGCTAPVNREPSPIFSLSFNASECHVYLCFRWTDAVVPKDQRVYYASECSRVGWREIRLIWKWLEPGHVLKGSLHCWDPSMFHLLRCLPALYLQCNSPIHRNLHLSACRSWRRIAGHTRIRDAHVWIESGGGQGCTLRR